jgi:aspartate/methionine/tyrosine aminotransferase
MYDFSNDAVKLEALRRKAFNYRWATHDPGVIPLTAADPDFPVAEPIVRAIHSYCADGYFSYGPPEGDAAFKWAISDYYNSKYAAETNPEYILPVNSAAYGLFVAAKTILTPGDTAIIPNPVDFLFRKAIESAGAEVLPISIDKTNAAFDLALLDQHLSASTKAIFICNPNNPLGRSLSKDHLEELIRWAQKHDLWIVSDEIWADIDLGGKVSSLLSRDLPSYEKKIVVSGLSKNYGLAGLRIGYIISQTEELQHEILQHSGHLTTAFGLSAISQAAGTAALTECGAWLENWLNHLRKMQALSLQAISELGLFQPIQPDATYLLFPAFKDPSIDSGAWVERALKEARVALVPGGTQWFESASEGHVRICFSTSEAILNEAFERLNDWVKRTF